MKCYTLGKVDGVQHLDPVFCPSQKLSYLANQAAFRVSDHIGAVKLHDVGFGEEAGLSRTAAPYDKDILVSRVLRILQTVGHHQPFGLCQKHIVFKHRVDKGLDVGGRTP